MEPAFLKEMARVKLWHLPTGADKSQRHLECTPSDLTDEVAKKRLLFGPTSTR